MRSTLAALWARLEDILHHPIYTFVKDTRDGFTHQRRQHSQLHGRGSVAYGVRDAHDSFRTVRGLEGSEHLAVLLAAYNLVLKPAIAVTADCVTDLLDRGITTPKAQ
jgi:hypothetical protein